MSSIGLSANDQKFEFLQLLVAQLQNQDPIEPTKQEDFMNQLAAFSTLEGVEELNVKFDDMLQVQQLGQGFDLAGKDVRYYDGQQTVTGHISEVSVLGGQMYAIINEQSVPVSSIISILG